MIFVKAGLRLLRSLVAVALTASIIAVAAPSAGLAARPNAYPVTNVNLRAGPGTDYPVIVTVPARAPISILGCLADYAWCDTMFEGNRGWMRSIYLSGYYQGAYYSLRDYAPRLGYRTVSFDINGYWNSNYRDRPFYGERSRWTAPREEGYVDTAVFYDRLSPYGDWTWLQGQYVWVPSRVDQSWRPYTRGRWVYTDRGWTWVSNEPFGWATYHYGRWGFSKRVGWFWVPGRRWAPAWVSWRSSDDYLAWAPLPPAPDEGVSINVTVNTPVPDYYWQVVPSHEFQSDDLSQRIVRDRDRSRPIIERAQPLGNVTVINNVIVNNNVTVNYVEEKTQRKVVTRRIERGNDPKDGSKVEADAVEIFQPAAEEKPKDVAPPKPKKVEEVAKESETKEQAGSEAATEQMLVPAEIKKATGETEAKPAAGEAPKEGEHATTPPPAQPLAPSLPSGKEVSAPPPGGGAPAGEPVPAEQATPPAKETPPPASGEQTPPPAQGKEALPPPPSEEAAPPTAEDQGAPAGKKEVGPEPKNGKTVAPPPAPSVEESAPAPAEKAAPPPPPAGEAVPPVVQPSEDSGLPNAKKQGKLQKEEVQPEEAPSLEPAAPQAPPPPSAEGPKAKKQGKQKEEAQPEEALEPPAPPPPPAEHAKPPNAKKQGKPKQEEVAPPEEAPSMGTAPSSEPPPPAADGDAPNNGKKAKKGSPKAEPCPEGTMPLEDGRCAPPPQ
jgi:uncharacterized protein YraI